MDRNCVYNVASPVRDLHKITITPCEDDAEQPGLCRRSSREFDQSTKLVPAALVTPVALVAHLRSRVIPNPKPI